MKKNLTEEEIYILKNKGTEKPFSGKLLYNKKKKELISVKDVMLNFLVQHQNMIQVQDGQVFGNQLIKIL